ncbi:hypothetical protein ACFHYQ_09570 [Sphaerimonospora cavernae]|uniref:Uncharacterized protein n=1 Tax=Sphaerimonospora cavernae TaxID=1740611 RepID=A0ABV6U260_9ACTN
MYTVDFDPIAQQQADALPTIAGTVQTHPCILNVFSADRTVCLAAFRS